MSTKLMGILALAATVCFLLLITFQVMEMNKYSSATTPPAAPPAPAAVAAETPAEAPAETPAPPAP